MDIDRMIEQASREADIWIRVALVIGLDATLAAYTKRTPVRRMRRVAA